MRSLPAPLLGVLSAIPLHAGNALGDDIPITFASSEAANYSNALDSPRSR